MGKRKVARPLDRRKPVHLTLKATVARGPLSLLAKTNRAAVEAIFKARAKKAGVVVRLFENVGNHIHAVVSFGDRKAFQNFLRTVTALIARHATGARRGRPFGGRFWDAIAFTRIVMGYRDLQKLETYLNKNAVERECGGDLRAAIESAERGFRREWRCMKDEIRRAGLKLLEL